MTGRTSIPSTIALGLGAGVGAFDMNQHVTIAGRSDSIAVYSETGVIFHWRNAKNNALLTALREIEQIQRGMRFTPDGGSEELLREARDGGMYGGN